MLKRFTHLRKDERGMSFVFIGMGFMSFLAASTLAIDVGMLMTARTQAQTSADAGALAGAVALAYNSSTNFSTGGPAVQSALAAARSDLVMGQPPSVDTGDVTFLPDPTTGNTTRVQVTVYRSAARGNPVATMIGRIFGINNADISATAIAEAIPANSSNCVKPFAIPDKWTEKQTGPWDQTDQFNAAILPPTFSPDVYKPVTDASYTGYKRTNVGLLLTINPAGAQVVGNQYYTLDLVGSYEGNIENCARSKFSIGEKIARIPASPSLTYEGLQALIGRDAGAYWDNVNNKVISTVNPSPRILTMPVYDPARFEADIAAGVEPRLYVTDFIGFFVQSVNPAGTITGRIVPVSGLVEGAAPVTTQAFPRAVRLVG